MAKKDKPSSTKEPRGRNTAGDPDLSENGETVQQRFAEARRTLDVTTYASYRDYLKDFFERIKTTRKSYSYVRLSADLGLSATNALWLTLNYRRDLSEGSARRIAASLEFTPEERQYFLTLVQHNNARRPDQRDVLMRELVALKSKSMMAQPDDNLEYFAEWYHPVIRELVGLSDFKADPNWVNNRLTLKLLPRQIEESIALLVKLGLIVFDTSHDRYLPTGKQIYPDRQTSSMAAIRYHQQACDIARESVAAVPATRRDLNILTLSISDESAMEVSKILYEACEKIMAFEQNVKDKDQVYQVNVQMFALTRS